MSADPRRLRAGRTAGRDRLRRLASRRVNTISLRNRLLRARRIHRALFWTVWEHREVRRLRSSSGLLPSATVAVVIPTFRRATMLPHAVASVLEQTYGDFTVIVVDDGGGEVDGLPPDPRVHIVRLRRNTRVLAVVNNIGIRLSRSRYVALLNDDNVWRPDHLERAVQALERGADLVYTGVRRHRPDGTEIDVLAVPFDRDALRRQFFVDSSALVARRGPGVLFERTPRGKRDPIKEDWEFVWRCSRTMRTELVPAITVEYLVHDGSYLTDWGT
jgi:glycosyltransferase involved in cell wall biosynthesis